MALFKQGGFVDDPWRVASDDANPSLDHDVGPKSVPTFGHHAPAGGLILTLAEWQALRDGATGDNALLGVRLEAGEAIEPIVPDLDKLALVALAFPKFGDGRSFSKAKLLREDYCFTGEIRAVGDVLWDQLQLMSRCGFDAFEITNEPTLSALRAGKKPVMTDYYQPGSGPETRVGAPRAWARRAVV